MRFRREAGMIHRYSPILCSLLALAGCQAPQVSAHIESVNAEYRQLEDYVYCLEEENARLCREVELLRQPSPTTPSTQGRGGLFRRRASTTPTEVEPGTPTAPPTIELPGTSASPSPGTSPPTIELPAPAATPPSTSRSVRPTAAEESILRPAPPKMPVDTK